MRLSMGMHPEMSGPKKIVVFSKKAAVSILTRLGRTVVIAIVCLVRQRKLRIICCFVERWPLTSVYDFCTLWSCFGDAEVGYSFSRLARARDCKTCSKGCDMVPHCLW